MKFEYSWDIFERYSNIKFHENPSPGSRVVPCGQTDGRTDGNDEANSRFSEFWESVQKQKLLVRFGANGANVGEAFIVGGNSLNTSMTT